MGWFSWFKKKSNRRRLTTTDLDLASENHRKTVRMLVDNKNAIDATLCKIAMIKQEALDIMSNGEIGDIENDQRETGKENSAHPGAVGGLYGGHTEGNQDLK